MYFIRGLAVKTEECLIPQILGTEEVLNIYPITGKIHTFKLRDQKVLEMEDEELNHKLNDIIAHIESQGLKLLFLDLQGSDIPIFYSNEFKKLRLNAQIAFSKDSSTSESVDVTGSLGDIIREMSSKQEEPIYFISEEEDGTILSIIRNY